MNTLINIETTEVSSFMTLESNEHTHKHWNNWSVKFYGLDQLVYANLVTDALTDLSLRWEHMQSCKKYCAPGKITE